MPLLNQERRQRAHTYANVKKELLQWARATSGYSLEQAAKKIGTTPQRLQAFESGELRPTVRQLRGASRVYKRPLAVFFLDRPPVTPEPLHDFRRLPGVDVPDTSPELILEMRRARRRRVVALHLVSEVEARAPTFPLRTDLNADIERIAARAREWLGVALSDQQSWRTEYDALNGWIVALESRGVLVFHTGEVEPEEARGFSIAASHLPVIVLNRKDSPRARVFTLMHEFAHLNLRQGGLCDPTRVGFQTRTDDERVEVFCNRFAGSLLVPADALLEDPVVARVSRPTGWDETTIRGLAERFSVSREVILIRLAHLGRTSNAFVSRKLAEYKAEYQAESARRAEDREEAGGFPPLYRLIVRDNGKRYTRLVLEALERERITLADVADYLGVRLKHLDRIASEVGVAVVER